MRTLPSDFSPTALAEIDRRLIDIRAQYNVHIPLAIESGSRAWGFPSPDSDYDCRFVFVRKLDAHLTPFSARDVIETPLIDLIDLNGWDLAKAIKLLLKGNAVIVEWLNSPIVYAGEAWFRDAFLAFARVHSDRNLVARHYLHLGAENLDQHFGGGGDGPLKKLFYAARPALALRWLRLHTSATFPPMNFIRLMAEIDLPLDVQDAFDDLIARKAETRELGAGAMPDCVRALLSGEFAMAETAFPSAPSQVSDAARAAATAFYRDMVTRLG